MRFELTVALKYLIPKWRQLSVSMISLISVLVISLVVWLVVLFLSVTEGIEKKWIEELVALNAPVRMTPTEAYYQSYYYLIDSVSAESNFSAKTIAEKLASSQSDPYDPRIDSELSLDFPPPDRYEDGRLKDPVKEGFDAIHSLNYVGIRPQEYEVSFGNLRLSLLRDGTVTGETRQMFLTQVSYIASHDGNNSRVNQMVLPPRAEDYNNLLSAIAQQVGNDSSEEETTIFFQETPENLSENLKTFFAHLNILQLNTSKDGFVLPPSLFPKQGSLKGIALLRQGKIIRVIVPKTLEELPSLSERLTAFGFKTVAVNLLFDEEQLHVASNENLSVATEMQIILDEKIPFQAQLLDTSLNSAHVLSDLVFQIKGKLQGISIEGHVHFEHLEIAEALQKIDLKIETGAVEPFWVYPLAQGGCHIPGRHTSTLLGEGLLVAKQFQKSGVCLGDRGTLSYYSFTGSSMQEQRIPVYVAGFYDPGMIPMGNKLIFVDPQVAAILRNNTTVSDPMLGNGINIWLNDLHDAQAVKEALIHSFKARGIDKYWTVQSYHDYEFTRPILEQLQSDKHLFTLIAVIILVVACSNIISMLILLVNDKKKEIGILQSMGASPARIATIFGLCGCVTGLISCVIGVIAAILTLKNLQGLVSFLSLLQGREAFQTAFYGSSLPNELSYSVLGLVLAATLVISLLAGVVPAIKASKVRPTEILRSE